MKTKSIENKKVLLTQRSESLEFIKIDFEDGTSNINTLTHPYLVKNKGWSSYDRKNAMKKYNVSVNKLEEGDIVYKLVNNKLKELRIKQMTPIKKKMKTYNLSNVKDNHNFFANGILVHNRS